MFAKALEQKINQRALPSVYIGAMLHAAIRSEKKRKIDRNDIFDFRHTSAALPHCTAFFTDGRLKKLITSGHMRLDKLYNCRIAATPSEAIAILKDVIMSP